MESLYKQRKARTRRIKRNGRQIHKKEKHAHREREKKKKKRYTGRDGEQQAKEEYTALSGDFINPLSSLNLSLFFIFKSEFLFGKTNKVGFHEEFLTPCMKF